MPDLGNPNFFTTFKGKYEVTLAPGALSQNANVMLTCTNEVQFLARFVPGENGLIGTLPSDCAPSVTTVLPVMTETGLMAAVTIEPTGSVSSSLQETVMLAGHSFNISSKWY